MVPGYVRVSRLDVVTVPLPVIVDVGKQSIQLCKVDIKATMLLCRNLQAVAVFYNLTKWCVPHDPALLWEKPDLVNIIENIFFCLDHDIEFAIEAVEVGLQAVLFDRHWSYRTGLGKTLLPFLINLRGIADRQRQGKLCRAGYADLVADLIVDICVDFKIRSTVVCRDSYRNWQEYFALIGKSNEVAAREWSPLGDRPDYVTDARASW